MRFLLLAFLSVLVVSCGQSGSTSGGSGESRQSEEYATVGGETDLLDVAIDVPVEITSSSIIFRQSVNRTDSGKHSECSIAVTSGETYTYAVSGQRMTVRTSSGERLSFVRKSGNQGIIGSWFGESFKGEQMIHRRLSILSDSRVVMRNSCES